MLLGEVPLIVPDAHPRLHIGHPDPCAHISDIVPFWDDPGVCARGNIFPHVHFYVVGVVVDIHHLVLVTDTII